MSATTKLNKTERARKGAIAQHKKHGCLIPHKSRVKGGKTSGAKKSGSVIRTKGKIAEQKFEQWAKENHYKIYNNGFPDRIIVKDDELIFVEIKTNKSKLSKEQRKIRNLFEKHGLNYVVWHSD